MSISDKFSNPGEWKVGSDCNLQFSKTVKTSPSTSIEVRIDGDKVRGPTFLAQILKEISANPKISDKLKVLKKNECVKIIFAGRGEYVLSKATKPGTVVERTISASFVITNNNPPPINRSTKPKENIPKKGSAANVSFKPPQSKIERKREDAKNADMWRQLEEKGEVEL